METRHDEELLAICKQFEELQWVGTAFAIRDCMLRHEVKDWASTMVKLMLDDDLTALKREENASHMDDVRCWVREICGPDQNVDEELCRSFFNMLFQYRESKDESHRRHQVLEVLREDIRRANQRHSGVSAAAPISRNKAHRKHLARRGSARPSASLHNQTTTDPVDPSSHVTTSGSPSFSDSQVLCTEVGPACYDDQPSTWLGHKLEDCPPNPEWPVTGLSQHSIDPSSTPNISIIEDRSRLGLQNRTRFSNQSSALNNAASTAAQEVYDVRPQKRHKKNSTTTVRRAATENSELRICVKVDVEPQPERTVRLLEQGTRLSNQKLVQSELPDHQHPFPTGLTPPIWAQTRQEICEGTPWFKSYQSGVYHKDGIVHGYLLGGHGSSGDRWNDDGHVIISHGGGKNELSNRAASNQSHMDQSVRCLIQTMKQGHPVVLLVDDNYRKFPYSLRQSHYGYVVLGAYVITHAWPQQQVCGGLSVIRWLFAFQWCSGQDNPWWLSNRHADSSMGIACKQFDKFDTSASELYEYAPALTFADPSRGRTIDKEYVNLSPFEVDPTTVTTDFKLKAGFHCGKCGRISCRFLWHQWQCRNCKRAEPILSTKQEVEALSKLPSLLKGKAYVIESKSDVSVIGERSYENGHLTVTSFTLAVPNDGVARVHTIRSRDTREANHIFALYEDDSSLKHMFQREVQRHLKLLKGGLLSNYFSHNAGEPYQYCGGDGKTVSLEEAPLSVQQALAYIKDRAGLALRGTKPDLNEVLSAAYLSEQKMTFHSDAEKGLGPVVAAVSLGSPAIMQFRPVAFKKKSEAKKQKRVVLTLELRHGDVVVMESENVQNYYQHAVTPSGFRFAATARYINPQAHVKAETPHTTSSSSFSLALLPLDPLASIYSSSLLPGLSSGSDCFLNPHRRFAETEVLVDGGFGRFPLA